MSEYKTTDDGDARKYWTQLPNLIDDAGLSVYAYRLYGHLKRVAGDTGKCWQGTRTLAKHCRMSVGSIVNAKNELVAAGLIRITEQGDPNNPYHEITIVDVWKKNMEQYCSPGEHPRSRDEHPCSPGELKNNTTKKNPIQAIVIPDELNVPEFTTTWNDFVEHRKLKKKPVTGLAAKRIFKLMGGKSVDTAIAMLDRTIANGWTGVFELDEPLPTNGKAGAPIKITPGQER